jgi:hypothetical protein
MQRIHSTATRRTRASALVALGCVTVAAGCGNDVRVNKNRPPAPITVAASISNARVIIDPVVIGAGPIVVIVANQSAASQEITFESEPSALSPGLIESTGPINPADTGQIQTNTAPGRYILRTDDDAIVPARLVVGPERETSQNELLLP